MGEGSSWHWCGPTVTSGSLESIPSLSKSPLPPLENVPMTARRAPLPHFFSGMNRRHTDTASSPALLGGLPKVTNVVVDQQQPKRKEQQQQHQQQQQIERRFKRVFTFHGGVSSEDQNDEEQRHLPEPSFSLLGAECFIDLESRKVKSFPPPTDDV